MALSFYILAELAQSETSQPDWRAEYRRLHTAYAELQERLEQLTPEEHGIDPTTASIATAAERIRAITDDYASVALEACAYPGQPTGTNYSVWSARIGKHYCDARLDVAMASFEADWARTRQIVADAAQAIPGGQGAYAGEAEIVDRTAAELEAYNRGPAEPVPGPESVKGGF